MLLIKQQQDHFFLLYCYLIGFLLHGKITKENCQKWGIAVECIFCAAQKVYTKAFMGLYKAAYFNRICYVNGRGFYFFCPFLHARFFKILVHFILALILLCKYFHNNPSLLTSLTQALSAL